MTGIKSNRPKLARYQHELPRENLDDLVRRVRGYLMLPDPDHSPSGGAELSVIESITLHVSGDLRAPIGSVGFGTRAVLRASVPEAAIDEDGHLLATKDDIGSATQALQWLRVYSISKATSMKLRPEGKLRAGVSLPIALHCRSDAGRRGRGRLGNDSDSSLGAHSIGGSF